MSENIKPLRICLLCKYLASSGGEYPEEYCSLGIEDCNPLITEDANGNMGCIYTDRQLKLMADYCDEQESHRYDGLADYMRGLDEIHNIEDNETRTLDPFDIVSGLENFLVELRNFDSGYWTPERVNEANRQAVLAAIEYIKSKEEIFNHD